MAAYSFIDLENTLGVLSAILNCAYVMICVFYLEESVILDMNLYALFVILYLNYVNICNVDIGKDRCVYCLQC